MENFLLIAPILLLSMVAHEYAHGYAALRQGDNTALILGRLTWNPVKHIDPVMTIVVPILTYLGSGGTMAFGGAKPVPVNPRLYRNYRRGDIIVSLAGIVTNLALSVVMLGLVLLMYGAYRMMPALRDSLALLQVMFAYGITVNLVLAAFNLIPIPPLDGSHVLKHLLPPRWAMQYQRIGSYGFILLMVLLTLGRPLLNLWMAPVFVVDNLAHRLVWPYLISPWKG